MSFSRPRVDGSCHIETFQVLQHQEFQETPAKDIKRCFGKVQHDVAT